MDVIRELRIASGLTQQEFSDILGFSQQAVSKLENNTAEPDISTLIKIAQYFEVSVDELLGLDPPEQIRKPIQEAKNSIINDNEIANTLKSLRKEKHLTQKQLAAETGLSLSSIISYENGLRKPNSKAMVALESFFGVSGEFLYKQQSVENYKTDYIDLDIEIDMGTSLPCQPKITTHDTDWIRKQISATASLYREYREELKACEQQEAQLKKHMTQLKKLMKIAKTNVQKMEEIINDEQS